MAHTAMAQHISITTPDLRAMSQPAAAMDPDISATLSDFLTYTEHLPSAVMRSMTLIETLNRKAASLQKQIHDLLTTYSVLPTITDDAPDPIRMRRDISHAYEKLEECKRMSAAEAARIEDMVTRDGRRLEVVSQKLRALPMPPSRDPTPEPVLSSPHLKRNSQAHTQAQLSADKRVAAHRTTTAPRVRNKDKLMVPGEVLPPPNPDSPPPSEPDDWPSPVPAPSQEQRSRYRSFVRPRAPRPPKQHKDKLQKTPRQRPPGIPGTNAHSAVAGISTSNAIMALTKPPADAMPGSKWLPWKRLTEFELAILRKRMKKNAAWRPSPAMRNRELKNLGRGMEAMIEAKAEADAAGKPFLDESDAWQDPTQTAISGDQQAEMNAILGPEKDEPDDDAALINRGMRLNEAKKLKRERQKLEEASTLPQDQQPPQQDQDQKRPKQPKQPSTDQPHAEEQKPARSPHPDTKKPAKSQQPEADPPRPTKSSPQSKPTRATAAADAISQGPPQSATEPASKKRKRDPTPLQPQPPFANDTEVDLPDTANRSQRPAAPERKKLKLNPPAAPPLESSTNSASSPKSVTPTTASSRMSTRPRSRRPSAAPEQASTQVPPTTRSNRTGPTITLKPPKAASAEPPIQRILRRGSNASLPGGGKKTESPAPKSTPPENAENSATTRPRRRRPVPGVVAAEEDGSAKVSIGKRNKPPAKKQSQPSKGTPVPTRREDNANATGTEEEVDPDEERYCICGDVSWGTMIACDNENCEKEWFHLECVKLKDMPPRRAKWYCPDCRKKLKLGQTTNGIVSGRA